MESLGKELEQLIKSFYEKHRSLDEQTASASLGGDKWTLKEIMGHLVDSASNNHQRFVRMQREAILEFPSYHYSWIDTGQYNTMPFDVILEAWKSFNLLLACLISRFPAATLGNRWVTGDGEISLEDLAVDYLRHMREHLFHFEERLEETKDSLKK